MRQETFLFLFQDLTDTDNTSETFIFICNLSCSINEKKLGT